MAFRLRRRQAPGIPPALASLGPRREPQDSADRCPAQHSARPYAPPGRLAFGSAVKDALLELLLLEAIPVSSRIIAVVDAFDAMTHDRPYQRAMPLAQALAELALHAGTQFDPAVVDAFTQAVSERWSAARAI